LKFVFWIILALFLLFLFLTIQTKRNKGKIKLKFLIPAVLFLVPCVLLSGIYVFYNMELKPQPSVSTVILENKNFRIGHAAKVQPATLDEYISIVAPQIKRFNQHSDEFWPNSALKDSAVYFVTNDKKQAWKVEYDGSYHKIENIKSVPRFDSIMGYPLEFYYLKPEMHGEKGMVLVISSEELLDQVRFEKYTHLGMYDPIITYIHEGFHIFTQGSDHWKEADIAKAQREDAFDNLEARKLRTYSIGLLYKALQDESNRDFYVKQALRLYQTYKDTFPEEYERVQYFERIEGSASYYEIVSCLQVSYPDTINSTNYTDAVALWTTNRQPQNSVGASHEAYELGAVAGVLLDIYSDDAKDWKEKLENDPESTPMGLLETVFTEEELQQVDVPEISQEYTDKLIASINKGRNVRNNLISFLYHIFF
jgi:hypothetical protein